MTGLGFSPDGRYLISGSWSGEVWRFPLAPTAGGSRARLLFEENQGLGTLEPAFDADSRLVAVSEFTTKRVFLITIDTGEVHTLRVPADFSGKAAFRKDGRLLAVAMADVEEEDRIFLRDLETGEERTLDTYVESDACEPERNRGGRVFDLLFLADGRLLTEGLSGLRIYDLNTGVSARLRPCRPVVNVANQRSILSLAPDGRTLLVAHVSEDTARTSSLAVFDIESRAERALTSHGDHVMAAALDSTGRYVVTGSGDGLVRFGPVDEREEPHLLYGHTARVTSVAASPDGRWIASASEDGTIRLWPLPEGRPFHTLPYEELLAKLRALTNLRVIADEGSASGYKVEPGPFPGWAKFPEW
jgi:WD40 repeat protein